MPVTRLLSYNIRYGGTGREAAIAGVIESVNADVVALQEATDPRAIETIAKRARYPYWGARFKHSAGFLSRFEVEHHAWHHPRGSKHAFLEVALAGRATRLFVLHLSAWFSKWSERRRHREIRALLEAIKAHQHGFHLLAGDFNALAPGEELQTAKFPRWIRAMIWASGRDIARDTIQTMLEAHYVDAWKVRHPGEPGLTFPTWDPQVRLDYVFAPERSAARILSCEVVRNAPEIAAASDHFPLLVEIADEAAPA